jgi:hypothetical protein
LQNYRGLRIIGFKGIIFLLKIPWNMSTVSWTGARQRGPPAQGLHKTGAVQITMEGSDPPGEGVRLFSNLDRYGEDGQRGPTGRWERRLPLQHHTSWPELCSEPPRDVAARVVRPKAMRGHRGYSPWVQWWRGMTPRWLTAKA